jgi:hypothetical protein
MINKHTMKQLTLILIILLTINKLNAQITINGNIVDENGIYLIGASIQELNTFSSVFSGIDGKFSILVSDSSKIRISFIGYLDTIFAVNEFAGDTIRMRPEPEPELLDLSAFDYYRFPYKPSMSIGNYGDFNGLPYGIVLSSFIPYVFEKSVLLWTTLMLKTDFQSNTDFSLCLGRKYIITKSNYRLSASLNFHYRDLFTNNNLIRVNDYRLECYNYLFHFITIYGGIIYRDNQTETNGTYSMIGLSKYISKTESVFSGEIAFVENDFEYSFLFSQGFSRKIPILKDIELGIEYKKYNRYDEYNFILSYSFFLK